MSTIAAGIDAAEGSAAKLPVVEPPAPLT